MSRPVSLKKPCLTPNSMKLRVPEAALGDRDFERFSAGARCGQRSCQYDRKCEGTAHDAQSSLIRPCLSSHGPGELERAQVARLGRVLVGECHVVQHVLAIDNAHLGALYPQHPRKQT